MELSDSVFSKEKMKEYIALILLGITFESIVVLIAYRSTLTSIDPLILAALGLASYRAGRAIAFNKIFEWLRAPFTKVTNDSSGAGQSVEPVGSGFQWMMGELLCCPICASSWAALVLFGIFILSPSIGTVMIYALAAAGIAEFLHWSSERAEWQGRTAREQAGTEWLLKNEGRDFRKPVIIVLRESQLAGDKLEDIYAQGWPVSDLFKEMVDDHQERPFTSDGK